jgi:hypothetical protein
LVKLSLALAVATVAAAVAVAAVVSVAEGRAAAALGAGATSARDASTVGAVVGAVVVEDTSTWRIPAPSPAWLESCSRHGLA